MVIESAKPGEVAWLNAAAYGLTPREEEVIELVARARRRPEDGYPIASAFQT